MAPLKAGLLKPQPNSHIWPTEPYDLAHGGFQGSRNLAGGWERVVAINPATAPPMPNFEAPQVR